MATRVTALATADDLRNPDLLAGPVELAIDVITSSLQGRVEDVLLTGLLLGTDMPDTFKQAVTLLGERGRRLTRVCNGQTHPRQVLKRMQSVASALAEAEDAALGCLVKLV